MESLLLLIENRPGSARTLHKLEPNGRVEICYDAVVGITVARTSAESPSTECRAVVVTSSGCLRLYATRPDVQVRPPVQEQYCDINGGLTHGIQLQQSTTDLRESIILRLGDAITLGSDLPSLTVALARDALTTVQVGSSQPEKAAEELIVSHVGDSMAPTSTEYSFELSRSRSAPVVDKSAVQSPPRASRTQSEKVEDTPARATRRFRDDLTVPESHVAHDAGDISIAEQIGSDFDTICATPSFHTPTSRALRESGKSLTRTHLEPDSTGLEKDTPTKQLRSASRQLTSPTCRGSPEPSGDVLGLASSTASPNRKSPELDTFRADKLSSVQIGDSIAENYETSVSSNHSELHSSDEAGAESCIQEKVDASEAAVRSIPPPERTAAIIDSMNEGTSITTSPTPCKRKSMELATGDRLSKKTKRLSGTVAVAATPRPQRAIEVSILSTTPRTRNDAMTPKKSPQTPIVSLEAAHSQSAKKAEAVYRQGQRLTVALSNSTIAERSSLARFMESNGCSIVQKVSEEGSDVLCIGRGSVKRTGKLLLATALGKPIVSDEWISRSVKEGRLLEPLSFQVSDPLNEAKSPPSESMTVQTDCRKLFSGMTLYFTPALKKDYGDGFSEIQEIVSAVGAKGVVSTTSRDVASGAGFIILGRRDKDLDADNLRQRGMTCYHKDLISTSILRGWLDLGSEEFCIQPGRSERRKTTGKLR